MATHDDIVLFLVPDLSYFEIPWSQKVISSRNPKKLPTICDTEPPRLELTHVEREVVSPPPVMSFNGLSP